MKRLLFAFTTLFVFLGIVLGTVFLPMIPFCEDSVWRKVDEELFIGEFEPLLKSAIKDSKITMIKINPQLYSFKLLSASEHGGVRMTARKWSEKFGLIAAINASMYLKDGTTSVGYMRNFNHLNNPRLNNSYRAVLAFNPTEPNIPEIQIIDLKCQDFENMRTKYQTFVQNIRMISCRQENVWAKQNQVWSMAVFGIDKSGNALFIFSEAPYSGHDFVNILLSLPISIFNALYLEGGAEANLFFSHLGVEIEKVGIRDTGLLEETLKTVARPIPNVIGITKKIR